MKANSLSSAKNLQDLITKAIAGLKKLTFTDNFESFKVQDIVIPYDSTAPNPEPTVISIRNELTFIPSQYIITSQEGHGLVTRSKEELIDQVNTGNNNTNTTKDWNLDYLYLQNNGPETVTITVIFMR